MAAVIKRDVSLSAFERWLNSKSFGMFSDNSADEAIRLVASVNLLIGELHEDVIDDAAFMMELSSLLNNILVTRMVDATREDQNIINRVRLLAEAKQFRHVLG